MKNLETIEELDGQYPFLWEILIEDIGFLGTNQDYFKYFRYGKKKLEFSEGKSFQKFLML